MYLGIVSNNQDNNEGMLHWSLHLVIIFRRLKRMRS